LLFLTGCASPKKRLEGLGIEDGIGDWRVRLVVRFMLWRRFGRNVVSDRTVDYGSRRWRRVKCEGLSCFDIPPGGREIVSKKTKDNRKEKITDTDDYCREFF
jgi:hypothetical protein